MTAQPEPAQRPTGRSGQVRDTRLGVWGAQADLQYPAPAETDIVVTKQSRS